MGIDPIILTIAGLQALCTAWVMLRYYKALDKKNADYSRKRNQTLLGLIAANICIIGEVLAISRLIG
jgi:hypothetical protein